jgi:phospholipid/cholesterol/gamma-HCH transport system permease protein
MLTAFGSFIINSVNHLGGITILTGNTIKKCFTSKHIIRRTVDQVISLGIKSLPMAVITSMFVGMAFTIQVLREFLKFGAGDLIGGIVGVAVWRELSPLLTGVVFSGRVGAAISAEIGSMKVTEQIDALETMSQDPIEYLVAPRLIACTVMMPLLTGIADIVGFFSGYIIAIGSGRVNANAYFQTADSMVVMNDIIGGLIKAGIFGFIIAMISTYVGLRTKSGAKGVGESTTKAVVVSLISVFIINYFLSVVLF